jgi:hypothetical protein
LLSTFDDAVAASGSGETRVVARIHVYGIAIVTLFATQGVDDAVTANLDGAVGATAIA